MKIKRKFELGQTVKLTNRENYGDYDEYSKVLRITAVYDDSYVSQYRVVPNSHLGKPGAYRGKSVSEVTLKPYEVKKLYAYRTEQKRVIFYEAEIDIFFGDKITRVKDKDIVLEDS